MALSEKNIENYEAKITYDENKAILTRTVLSSPTKSPGKQIILFDNIFNDKSTKIFEESYMPVLQKFLSGINSAIIIFNHISSYESEEITTKIPLKDIQKFLDINYKKNTPKEEAKFHFSAFSIHNENIKDLLNPDSNSGPFINENSDFELRKTPLVDALDVEGYIEKPLNEISDVFSKIPKNRILRIKLSVYSEGILLTQSILIISELLISDEIYFPLSKITPETQYLYAIANCAKSLSKKNKGLLNVHVPYRMSILTRILQEALGGKCLTYAILYTNSMQKYYETGLGILEIMNEIRDILNFPRKNYVNTIRSPYLINVPPRLYDIKLKPKKEVDESEAEIMVAGLRKSNEKLRTELLYKYYQLHKDSENSGNIMQEIMKMKNTIKTNLQKISQHDSPYYSLENKLYSVFYHKYYKIKEKRK